MYVQYNYIAAKKRIEKRKMNFKKLCQIIFKRNVKINGSCVILTNVKKGA
jgi:hypothetical protein